jgi:hypothetical protein
MTALVIASVLVAIVGFSGAAIVWARYLGLTTGSAAAQLPEQVEPAPTKPVCSECRWADCEYFCISPNNVPEVNFINTGGRLQSRFNSRGQCQHWKRR